MYEVLQSMESTVTNVCKLPYFHAVTILGLSFLNFAISRSHMLNCHRQGKAGTFKAGKTRPCERGVPESEEESPPWRSVRGNGGKQQNGKDERALQEN